MNKIKTKTLDYSDAEVLMFDNNAGVYRGYVWSNSGGIERVQWDQDGMNHSNFMHSITLDVQNPIQQVVNTFPAEVRHDLLEYWADGLDSLAVDLYREYRDHNVTRNMYRWIGYSMMIWPLVSLGIWITR